MSIGRTPSLQQQSPEEKDEPAHQFISANIDAHFALDQEGKPLNILFSSTGVLWSKAARTFCASCSS
ncbi:MAG TPA: hypothetical protein VEZ55_14560 [Chitinophagaceae bacterium]|nr:hypothetical protein [Chitinophagaceae bacterium]